MALSTPVTDTIGQKCATLKVMGDNDTVEDTVYFAVRTTGPYVIGDGADIRSGVGSVATAQQPNITRIHALIVDLESDLTHYWGAVKATGDAVVASFTTQAVPVDQEAEGVFAPAGINL